MQSKAETNRVSDTLMNLGEARMAGLQLSWLECGKKYPVRDSHLAPEFSFLLTKARIWLPDLLFTQNCIVRGDSGSQTQTVLLQVPE